MKSLEQLKNQPHKIAIHIPMDDEVYFLRNLFADEGHDLLAVGGVVRDYLFHVFHDKPFVKKDIDLVTDAKPQKVMHMLEKDAAWTPDFKVKVIGQTDAQGIKQVVGAQFGIVPVNVYSPDGSFETYEIATYREDSETGDGRRPDSVEFSNIAIDAQRRDLTINALYYAIPPRPGEKGQVLDFNEGQGIEDVKNKKVSPVGRASDRFEEDNLRVMRLLRFHGRFSGEGPSSIENADRELSKAIRNYAAMPNVSNERLQQEFVSGLKSAIDPVNYLTSLSHFGVLDRMFPGLDTQNRFHRLYRLQKDESLMRNPRIVLAFTLQNNEPEAAEQALKTLKFPVSGGTDQCFKLTGNVRFLLEMLKFDPNNVYMMDKSRDRLLKQPQNADKTKVEECLIQHRKELVGWATLMGLNMNDIQAFIEYKRTISFQHPEISGAGLKGEKIAAKIKELETQKFLNSLQSNK